MIIYCQREVATKQEKKFPNTILGKWIFTEGLMNSSTQILQFVGTSLNWKYLVPSPSRSREPAHLKNPPVMCAFQSGKASSIAVCHYYQCKIVLTSTHCTASAVVASSFPQFSFTWLQMHVPSSNSCNCITIHRHDMEGLWSVYYCCWCLLVDCMK